MRFGFDIFDFEGFWKSNRRYIGTTILIAGFFTWLRYGEVLRSVGVPTDIFGGSTLGSIVKIVWFIWFGSSIMNRLAMILNFRRFPISLIPCISLVIYHILFPFVVPNYAPEPSVGLISPIGGFDLIPIVVAVWSMTDIYDLLVMSSVNDKITDWFIKRMNIPVDEKGETTIVMHFRIPIIVVLAVLLFVAGIMIPYFLLRQ